MKRIMILAVLFAAAGTLAAAQLYRWVDDKGNVEYRDSPPPKGAKKVEEAALRQHAESTTLSTSPAGDETSVHAVGVRLRDVQGCSRAARAPGVPYSEGSQGDLSIREVDGRHRRPALLAHAAGGLSRKQWRPRSILRLSEDRGVRGGGTVPLPGVQGGCGAEPAGAKTRLRTINRCGS